MERILVTGGAGFIGSHLAEAYLNKGHDVYVIDDLSTGSKENIRHLEEHPHYQGRFHATFDSVLNYDVFLELVGTCDIIFHLAAAVGVQYILDNPLSSLINNIRGAEIALELCSKFRKKIIITSSSEVYGKHANAPLEETADCVYGSSDKFRWSYAATKLIDEILALAYFRKKGLHAVVVRLFNTVGPRQTGQYGMVIPRFVKQALRNEPITVYGDGSQTRTFTHVNDVVEAFMRLAQVPEAAGQVINIGGTLEISMLDLAGRIKELTGSSSEIRIIPYDQAYPQDFEDMQRRVPSTEKLKRLVGHVPETGLDAILHDVIGYLKYR